MWWLRLSLPCALAAAVALAPAESEACGGTFCDGNLPGSMPVNQTGETILFAIDSGFVEAHVQIQYDGGDADQFAWLVPVPEIPEIEVGSWRLVQSALAGTIPVYGFEDNWVCEDMDPPPAPPSTSGIGFIEMPDGGSSGPTVVSQDVVGAFEFAILQGGSSESVTDWLIENDYAVEEEAPTILDDYIDEGHVFVAFKLRHGQAVEDIHPVVIRYPGTEPCIPIRLTRVAAEDDMDIRALFLGESRVVSTTYRHVEINEAQLNWLGFGSNYRDVVTMAVDAEGADGRAFVTEYAGPSDVIDTALLDSSAFDADDFAGATVLDVVEIMEDQGLLFCSPAGCQYGHELASSLIHEFIPVPEGIEEGDFYSCLSCYATAIDQSAWDLDAFLAAYEERIVAPMRHASDLLETWPYVTRLYTTISPHEMTADPMFTENPELDEVANRHGAQRNQACCGNAMQLPDGRVVWLDQGNGWPAWDTDMPWAERVLEYTGEGAAIELSSQSEIIDGVLADWNAATVCSDDGPGTTGGSQPPGQDPPDGFGTTGGDPGAASSAADGADGEPVGCACTTTGNGGAPWALLAFGFGLMWRRRRSA